MRPSSIISSLSGLSRHISQHPSASRYHSSQHVLTVNILSMIIRYLNIYQHLNIDFSISGISQHNQCFPMFSDHLSYFVLYKYCSTFLISLSLFIDSKPHQDWSVQRRFSYLQGRRSIADGQSGQALLRHSVLMPHILFCSHALSQCHIVTPQLAYQRYL